MAKPNKKYWEGRAAQREMESQLIASKYLARMDESLREAQQDILRQIEAFYARYSIENQVTLAGARKYLTVKELKDFKNIDLKRFREMSLSGNPEYDRILNATSYRVRISRLEALNMNIEMRMVELYGSKKGLQEYTYTGLTEVYQTAYYQSMFSLAQAGAVTGTVAALTDKTMQEVLTYNWSGKEFSNRIWDHQSGALKTIQKELERSFASGRSIQKTTKAIMDATDVSKSRVEALVRTESNFFHGLAAQNSYIDAGIEKYEVLATLDSRTSAICQEQDGKIYDVKKYEPGVTANPFHARCRTTTVAWFDESEYTDGEERIARDPMSGETYHVPADMTYEQWYQKHVVDKHGQENVDAMQKKVTTQSSDKKQYEKYKQIFGKDLDAKSFVEFQDLKYTNSEKWDELKGQKQSILNSREYRDSFYGKFGNREVRQWYIHHDENIVNKLDLSKSSKEQAVQAHSLRNKYRTEARLMMKDRDMAKSLDSTDPHKTFDDLLNHKQNKYGLVKEEAYKDIIRSSQTTNKAVNKKHGIEE